MTEYQGMWFFENNTEHLLQGSALKNIYYTGRSKYQKIDVVQLGSFGRCLILDNKVQSSEDDEWLFHENLVHPVLLAHHSPKTIFIGGGGEGATAREILRHKTVERVVMVDIDEDVIRVSKQFLPNHHQGCFEDKRLELRIEDAKDYLENVADHTFDVIVLDLSDPVRDGPAWGLYTQNFYKMCLTKLKDRGLLVTQSGPCGVLTDWDVFRPINHTLRTVFPNVTAYSVHVPSYGDEYGFNVAQLPGAEDPGKFTVEEVNKRIKERIIGWEKLKSYDGIGHQRLFSLPKPIRNGIAEQSGISTRASDSVKREPTS
jgi:spermidine synthase